MLIYRNAEGVHAREYLGSPAPLSECLTVCGMDYSCIFVLLHSLLLKAGKLLHRYHFNIEFTLTCSEHSFP